MWLWWSGVCDGLAMRENDVSYTLNHCDAKGSFFSLTIMPKDTSSGCGKDGVFEKGKIFGTDNHVNILVPALGSATVGPYVLKE